MNRDKDQLLLLILNLRLYDIQQLLVVWKNKLKKKNKREVVKMFSIIYRKDIEKIIK